MLGSNECSESNFPYIYIFSGLFICFIYFFNHSSVATGLNTHCSRITGLQWTGISIYAHTVSKYVHKYRNLKAMMNRKRLEVIKNFTLMLF